MRPLLVKVTCAGEAAERANQGLTVAATAADAGAEVSLWLTGAAVYFATPECPDLGLESATPTRELVDTVLAHGRVTVCSQCAYRRVLTIDDLLPGAQIAGAASFVEEALTDDVQALVY